ncbi:MAG: hypothetical protein ABI091_28350, partial [Ferruginibacter sp.]
HKKFNYFIFGQLSKIKTTFFSETYIAMGYFLKNQAEFVKNSAIEYKSDRFELHDFLAGTFVPPARKIHFLEFGVRWGQIITKWAEHNKNPDSIFTGFDTFTGLPEDWGNVKKGSFSNEGNLPNTNDSRTSFCVGLVQDTLPDYLKKINPGDRFILHLDFDIYNATLFSLVSMAPYLKKGDIIILDEYFSITKNHHEYRAFCDFISLFKFQYKSWYKCRGGQFVIEILE